MTSAATFPDRFRTRVTTRGLLPKRARVLVAVSGRSDSMALLHLLEERTRAGPHSLHVGHVQHGTAPDAVGDRTLVEETGKRLHLPVSLREDPETLASPGAREVSRARLLVQMLEALRCDVIATGETKEDAAVVLLATLLRGRSADLPLRERTEHWVRPLLTFSHQECFRYLSARGIPFRPHPAPFSLETERGALALLILPLLRRQFGEAALANLAQVERDLAEDEDFLDDLALLARQDVGWLVHEHTVNVAWERWTSLPAALRRRLLAAAAQAAGSTLLPAAAPSELAAACAVLTENTEQTLQGLNVRRSGGMLFITRSSEKILDSRS